MPSQIKHCSCSWLTLPLYNVHCTVQQFQQAANPADCYIITDSINSENSSGSTYKSRLPLRPQVYNLCIY